MEDESDCVPLDWLRLSKSRALLRRGHCSRGGLLEWVAPAQAFKPGEVGVVAVQFGLVFHRERCELGVGREVAGCAEFLEIIEEKAGELRPGFESHNCWLIQP